MHAPLSPGFALDPVTVAPAHQIERRIDTYLLDGEERTLGRVRCRGCRRTRYVAFPSPLPAIPAADYRTLVAAQGLHSGG